MRRAARPSCVHLRGAPIQGPIQVAGARLRAASRRTFGADVAPDQGEQIHAVNENSGVRRRWRLARVRRSGRARQCAVAQQSRRCGCGSGIRQAWRRRRCTGGDRHVITPSSVAPLAPSPPPLSSFIAATGTADKRGDAWRRHRTGPLHCGPVSIRKCLETGEIAVRYLASGSVRGVRHEELDRRSLCRRRARGCRAGGDRFRRRGATGEAQIAGTSDATDFSAHRHVRRHYRHYGYYRPSSRPFTTAGRSTIGRIPIIHRRRSPSASGLGRPGGEALRYCRVGKAQRAHPSSATVQETVATSMTRLCAPYNSHPPVFIFASRIHDAFTWRSLTFCRQRRQESDGDQPQSG